MGMQKIGRALRGAKMAKAAVCLFFVCFLLLGLITAGDYGQPWDELDEMDILRMNLWQYARAFGQDESAFESWAEPNEVSLNKLVPISQSIEQDHGQSAFYPLATVVMDRGLSGEARQLYWHMWCWALFTLGAYALYACCRQLGLSRFFSLLAAAMLLLSPRFFAEGHYNNKDVVLMALALCALWQGLRLMKKPTFPRAVWFAFFGALCANTKLAGVALWGLCALFVLVRQIVKKNLRGRVTGVGCVAFFGFLAFYAALTPALWGDPLGFVKYLAQNAVSFTRWGNDVLFRGVVFQTAVNPLPWYYLPYMMLATTPLWALLLMAIGQVTAVFAVFGRHGLRAVGEARDEALGLLLVSLLWLLPLGFAIVTRTRVYNGWRHFYFLYGPMLALAAYGASRLWRRLCAMRPRWLRRAFAVMMAACMALTGVGIALDHPYQFAYYQPIVQLLAPGDNWLELDYWNVSVQNALEALCRSATGELTVGYADDWAKIGLKRALVSLPETMRSRIAVTDDASAARYVLCNPTYAVFSGFTPEAGMAEAIVLRAYGREMMKIYERSAAR